MNILNYLRNFLYNNEDFIDLYDNKIYLYNIDKISLLNEELALISFKNKIIKLKGKNIKTYKYCDRELVLSGFIESVSLNEKESIS